MMMMMIHSNDMNAPSCCGTTCLRAFTPESCALSAVGEGRQTTHRALKDGGDRAAGDLDETSRS